MLDFKGKSILERQLDVYKKFNINNIIIVLGYKSYQINVKNVNIVHNPLFDKTNMVYSLYCAKDYLLNTKSDIIISYGDIIFEQSIIEKLLLINSDFSIVVDKDWLKVWNIRFKNPLDDAETLKLDDDGYIKEIGRKTDNINEIEGQYIGLIKIKNSIIEKIFKFYENLQKSLLINNFQNIYMTDFYKN